MTNKAPAISTIGKTGSGLPLVTGAVAAATAGVVAFVDGDAATAVWLIATRSRGLNRRAVDESAVGRVFIDDPDVVALAVDGRVQPREAVVGNTMIDFLAPAKRCPPAVERDLLRAIVS
jgi:hypothetical protein